MKMGVLTQPVTVGDYDRRFADERIKIYPPLDRVEFRLGYALKREVLEDLARVLACPVKVNPPCWQHGRLLYAWARKQCAESPSNSGVIRFLDIGTAKGFSAMCLALALYDADTLGEVVSVDVLDPKARVPRNTVVELAGLLTLEETLAPWRETADGIRFVRMTGEDYLRTHPERYHLVFVDGKHNFTAVRTESQLIAARQKPGDVIIFDDLQIRDVCYAVNLLNGYDLQEIALDNGRRYAVAVKR